MPAGGGDSSGARVGASPLRVDGRLMKAAQLQAEQMATLGRMDHVLNNGPYPAPQDRLETAQPAARSPDASSETR